MRKIQLLSLVFIVITVTALFLQRRGPSGGVVAPRPAPPRGAHRGGSLDRDPGLG